MKRVGKQLLPVRNFYHLPQVHDGNPVADIVHSPQSVADKNTGKSQLLLQIPEQVQYLGLYGHIQGADRFITHQQSGIQGKGPGNTYALPLSAGEFMGISSQTVLRKPHHIQQLLHMGIHIPAPGQPMIQHGLCQYLKHMLPGVQG